MEIRPFIVYYEDEQTVLVIEDKPEATAAAEISDPNLAKSILRYNHYSLKGDIHSKKDILLALGAELEPRKKELSIINKELTDLVFYTLNNLNIRHNNIKIGDKYYNSVVANMADDELEKWYDELYQMILLAMLELDNVQRMSIMKDLKKKIIS